ncbi:hypothetical protein CMV_015613 [Castanea mollissima]|uniref:Uncharacterized protein n=1 Tax=Castanea mollissima TaxID=60419 RepID=A0A8J4QUU0_9ROSI|nr:hypothetical protein CMV_015613 [Castanea mollissima]
MRCISGNGIDGGCWREFMLTEEREHNPPLAKESLCHCWECAFSSSVIISCITLTFWSSSNGSVAVQAYYKVEEEMEADVNAGSEGSQLTREASQVS